MADLLSNYNYVRKPNTNPKKPAEALAEQPSTIPNSTTEINSPNKPNNSETATMENSSNSDYTTDFKETFKTFQELKGLLKFNKFIQCFKKIAKLTKNCKDPMEKIFLIVSAFDDLTTEFKTPYNE